MLGWASQQFEKLSQTVAPPPTDATGRFLYAVQRGDEPGAMAAVQEMGPDLVARNRLNPTRGCYAIHMACQQGMNSLIRHLVTSPSAQPMGGSVNYLTYVDSTGNTPLHYACLSTDVARALVTVKMLVMEFQASVVAKNSLGQTPYDVAILDSVRQFLLPLQLQQETQQALDNGGIGLPPGIDMGGLRITNPAAPPPPTNVPHMMMSSPKSAPMPPHATLMSPQQQQQAHYPLQHQHSLSSAPTDSHATSAPVSSGGGGGYALTGGSSAQLKGFRKPDGFHSSSSDVSLQRKYGHVPTNQYAHVPPPPSSANAMATTTTTATTPGANPFSVVAATGAGAGSNPYASVRAKSCYVAYDAVSNTTSTVPMTMTTPMNPTAYMAPAAVLQQPTPAAAATSTFGYTPVVPAVAAATPSVNATFPPPPNNDSVGTTPAGAVVAGAGTTTMPTTTTTPLVTSSTAMTPSVLFSTPTTQPTTTNENNNMTTTTTTTPDLPLGWKEETDPASGQKYYYNEQDGTTTWERPTTTTTTNSLTQEQPQQQQPEVQPVNGNAVPDATATLEPAAEITSGMDGSSKDNANKETVPSSEALLPAGWREVTDPASGMLYYYNELDGTTSWDKPQGQDQQPVNGNGAAASAAHETQPSALVETSLVVNSEKETSPSLPNPDELPPGWKQAIDPASGNVYFYNELDGTTSWERPTPIIPSANVEGHTEQKDGNTQEQQQEQDPSKIDTPQDDKDASATNMNASQNDNVQVETTETNTTVVAPVESEASGATPAENAPAPSASGLPEGWQESIDPSSGRVYYYHLDGRTSWDLPEQQQTQAQVPAEFQEPPAPTTASETFPAASATSVFNSDPAPAALSSPFTTEPVVPQVAFAPGEISQAPPQAAVSFGTTQPTAALPAASVFGSPPSGNLQTVLSSAPLSSGAPPVSASDLFSSPFPAQSAMANEVRAATAPVQSANATVLFASTPTNGVNGGTFSIPAAPRSGALELFASPPSQGVDWKGAAMESANVNNPTTTTPDAFSVPSTSQPTSSNVSQDPMQASKPAASEPFKIEPVLAAASTSENIVSSPAVAAEPAPQNEATDASPRATSPCGSEEMLDDVPLSPDKQSFESVTPSEPSAPAGIEVIPPPLGIQSATLPVTPAAESLFAAIGMPPPPFSSKRA